MAISQPTSTDGLNSPDHSLSHRVFANDSAAPVKSIVVDSTGAVIIGNQGVTNYTQIDANGVITYAGTAKRSLTCRPHMSTSQIIKTGGTWELKPTPIEIGAFTGFTMPVYNSDNQELYFRMRAPYRWDGTTNPTFKMIVCLSAAEDVGDKFKFQLEWNNASAIPTALQAAPKIEADVVTLTDEVTVATDRNAQYSTYSVSFTLDIDDAGLQQVLEPRNNLVGRIRRIASGAPAVSNNIYILDWITGWTVDKVFGSF